MEGIDLGILIAGGLVPFAVSLLKRFVTLTKEQISLVTMVISFAVASVFELINCSFDFSVYITKLVTVYGTSQIIYWAVLKSLELDTRIEGK
jgi:hypothetical protein